MIVDEPTESRSDLTVTVVQHWKNTKGFSAAVALKIKHLSLYIMMDGVWL